VAAIWQQTCQLESVGQDIFVHTLPQQLERNALLRDDNALLRHHAAVLAAWQPLLMLFA
jgi:hypothetical protein